MAISESDTDLRWCGTLLGELDDLITKIVGGDLDPAWGSSSVRKTSASNTFALGIHATHFLFSTTI